MAQKAKNNGIILAGFMARVGILLLNLREASRATFVVLLPLITPLMMSGVLVDQPNGGFGNVLSLFPLTSPVVMMTRLAARVWRGRFLINNS